MTVREYVGARYVPILADPLEWDSTVNYEPLTIVLHQGNSFTSRQYVPAGVEITNEGYWASTGNYNAQIEAYRREVAGFGGRIDDVEDEIEEISGNYARDFKTVADMKLATLDSGIVCHTEGFHSAGDNGAAYYLIGTTGTPNEKDVISCAGGKIATLVNAQPYATPEMFGAYGDSTHDDTASIQAAIKSAFPVIEFSGRTYKISDRIDIPSNKVLEGNYSTISVDATSTSWNDYASSTKVIFRNANPGMVGACNKNITIKNLVIHNNGLTNSCRDGVIQFRGVYDGLIEGVHINCSGSNIWGILLFSDNKNVTVNNCYVNNTSAEGELGGCFWIRSGLAASPVPAFNYATLGVNVTNSIFASTAADEIVALSSGIDATRTEVNFTNCYILGLAQNTYSSFLLSCWNSGNASILRVNISDVVLYGNCGHAMLLGREGIVPDNLDMNISNLTAIIENGNGIRGFNANYTVRNSIIKCMTGAFAAYRCTLRNCKIDGQVQYCYVYDCDIDAGSKNACADCKRVENSIIRTNGVAINYYGGTEGATWKNNHLYVGGLAGIRVQSASATNRTAVFCDISGNMIERQGDSDNTGSVGINVQWANYCRIADNMIKISSTGAGKEGFQYATNIDSSSTNVETGNLPYTKN